MKWPRIAALAAAGAVGAITVLVVQRHKPATTKPERHTRATAVPLWVSVRIADMRGSHLAPETTATADELGRNQGRFLRVSTPHSMLPDEGETPRSALVRRDALLTDDDTSGAFLYCDNSGRLHLWTLWDAKVSGVPLTEGTGTLYAEHAVVHNTGT